MANVPLLDAAGVQIGTVPNRSSKNPVIGVIACDCGLPATVHNPRGKRSGRYYTMCDECGTDQRAGDTRQAKIRENMVQTIEELPLLVNSVQTEKAEPEAVTGAEKAEPAEAPQATQDAVYTASEAERETHKSDPAPEAEQKPIRLFVALGAMLGAALAVAL